MINRHKQKGFFLNPYRFGIPANDDPVLLLLRGSGLYTTALADTSSYFRTVTNVGAQSRTEQSKFGTTSILTNGSAAYVHSSVTLGSGDFTVEFWVYPTAIASSGYGSRVFQIGDGGDANDGLGICAFHWNNGTHAWIVRQGYSAIAGAAAPIANAWQHVAVTKSAAGITIFVGGVRGGTIANSVNFNTSKTVYIGTSAGSWEQNIPNYMDEVRITKGIALYTDNFVPPAAAFNDPVYDVHWWDNVALLMNMEGPQDSTTFTDNSPYQHSLYYNGTVKQRVIGKKTGFTGTEILQPNSYIFAGNADNQTIGTNDFTAEAWIHPTIYDGNSQGTPTYIIGQHTVANTTGRWFMGVDTVTGSNTKALALYYEGAIALLGNTAIPNNQWNHVAVSRYAGVTRLFLNGILVGSTSTALTLPVLGFSVGGSSAGTVQSFCGYMDDVRVTNGIARYTANFPVPYRRYPQGLSVNLDVPDYQSYIGSGAAWNDVSGFGRHSTLTSTTYDTNNGGSFVFNGSTSGVVLSPNIDVTLTNNFTIEVWCCPTATRTIEAEGTSGIGAVVNGGARFTVNANHGGAEAHMGISVGTNGVTVNEHGGSYAPAPLVYNATISNTTMSHICVVYSGGRPSLYVNGTFVRQGLQSPRTVHCMMNNLGYGDYGINQYVGRIAQVRAHPRVFTAGDVTKAFNASRGRYGI